MSDDLPFLNGRIVVLIALAAATSINALALLGAP
jgi:hypothetical protein